MIVLAVMLSLVAVLSLLVVWTVVVPFLKLWWGERKRG